MDKYLPQSNKDVATHSQNDAASAFSPVALATLPNADLDLRHRWLGGAFTGGIAPMAYGAAFADWSFRLLASPRQGADLARSAADISWQFAAAMRGESVVAPESGDHRFSDPAWQAMPYRFFAQSFLLAQQWTRTVTAAASDTSPADARLLSYVARQWLDLLSPSNIPWLNPEILGVTAKEHGANLARGLAALIDDTRSATDPKFVVPAEGRFQPGKSVAITPGKVVFRNALMELIQYAPATASVHPEPVLIVPAWIMKYYILDLQPHNSLIRYMVAAGHTVFCISWRNPPAEMAGLDFDAYRRDGLMTALDVIGDICTGVRVHAAGYCLGGTLLAIGAAAMARDGDTRLASMTLFAAQVDFTEPGEMQIFISEEQVAALERKMATKGYLDGREMGGAFQMLRARDLIWSRAVNAYLLGQREVPNDLAAWNSDTTRMPARMHSEYLRELFLHNDLAEGRYRVEGQPIGLDDIDVPVFAVGTETDHVAPWKSVYKIHGLTPAAVTFVLTSGGHNAGIVSEPGHPHRHFRIAERAAGTGTVAPDDWFAQTAAQDGSWWPAWSAWLANRSGAADNAPPPLGTPLNPPIDDAPGRYILER